MEDEEKVSNESVIPQHDSQAMNNMQEQFNLQRAKMRDLYMMKEKECMQMKQKCLQLKKELEEKESQLVILEYNRQKDIDDRSQEILTLQQLLQETCDEATIANNEIAHLRNENERARSEVAKLQEVVQQESSKSLDSILGLKTLARNMKKITSNSQETSSDDIKKVAGSPATSKYAQEDADTLRSLVEPLEDEICQLKEKLRAAYDEMETVRGVTTQQPKSALMGLLAEDATSKIENQTSSSCSNCEALQLEINQLQQSIDDEKQKVVKVEKVLDRLKQDLLKESSLRLDLEKVWQDKREAHKDEVQNLCDKLKVSEENCATLHREFKAFKQSINSEIARVMADRQQINEYMENLQRDNDYLACRYLEHSTELSQQDINLPQNVDELHELVLRLNENLILSKTGQEFNEKKSISARDEANLLRDTLVGKDKEMKFLEHKLTSRIKSLEENIRQQHSIHLKHLSEKEELSRKENECKKQISDLMMQNIALSDKLEQQDKSNLDMKQKVIMLQQDLATSETVQKDFVRLSQSLQMQLEKIRSADTQVRWQEDDDYDSCAKCRLEFTVTRRKMHCRHCGTIFCENCCKKTVKSGPSGKICKVCDICHTLLEQNSAPYFSQTPSSP